MIPAIPVGYSVTSVPRIPPANSMSEAQNEQTLSALPPKAENGLRPQLMSSTEKAADAELHRARYEPSRGRNPSGGDGAGAGRREPSVVVAPARANGGRMGGRRGCGPSR